MAGQTFIRVIQGGNAACFFLKLIRESGHENIGLSLVDLCRVRQMFDSVPHPRGFQGAGFDSSLCGLTPIYRLQSTDANLLPLPAERATRPLQLSSRGWAQKLNMPSRES